MASKCCLSPWQKEKEEYLPPNFHYLMQTKSSIIDINKKGINQSLIDEFVTAS